MNEIVTYYNELASRYDDDRFNNTYGRYIDALEKKLLDRLLQNSQGIVLDLACGSGRLLQYATCGLDASPAMTAIAKAKYPEKIIHTCSATQLPFDDQSVQTIISFHFFMHLDRNTVQDILKECHRVLQPGGRIIFDIPSKKRRKLLHHQQQSWHGGLSMTIAELKALHPALFVLQQSFGLLLFPIHRFPKKIRRYCQSLDGWLAASVLKEYSSYLIITFVKQ